MPLGLLGSLAAGAAIGNARAANQDTQNQAVMDMENMKQSRENDYLERVAERAVAEGRESYKIKRGDILSDEAVKRGHAVEDNTAEYDFKRKESGLLRISNENIAKIRKDAPASSAARADPMISPIQKRLDSLINQKKAIAAELSDPMMRLDKTGRVDQLKKELGLIQDDILKNSNKLDNLLSGAQSGKSSGIDLSNMDEE